MISVLAGVIALLAILGAPLFIVIAALALLGFFAVDVPMSALIVELYRLTSAPALLAIPLFTFGGCLLSASKAPQRLVDLSNALLGWMPGGLGVVALVSCAIFTAFTGASGVTIVALGSLLYPMLIQQGYPERMALGLLTTSGSNGLLFPPSLPVIIYGIIASTSVDKLFVAGIVPGILMTAAMAVYTMIQGWRHRVPRTPFAWENLKKAAWAARWEIPLPFVVIVGIYGGFFTATEAAAITAFYAWGVECFLYREIHLTRELPRVMKEGALLSGAVLLTLGCALGFASYLIDQQIPMKILSWITRWVSGPLTFLLLLNVFLLMMGGLLDMFSAIVVIPLIAPIAAQFGINPIHLGIIFLANLEIGYDTPPIGLNLFIGTLCFKKSIAALCRASIPYVVILLITLAAITYWPALTLGPLRFFTAP